MTPLNAQLERLSKLIGVLGFGVAALTYAALVLHGAAIGELVLTGQAVGVLPDRGGERADADEPHLAADCLRRASNWRGIRARCRSGWKTAARAAGG